MVAAIKSRTSLLVLISAMALVFCFQLGTQFGRTGDEAAGAQLEQKLQLMDEHIRQEVAPGADLDAEQTPVANTDRGPVAP